MTPDAGAASALGAAAGAAGLGAGFFGAALKKVPETIRSSSFVATM